MNGNWVQDRLVELKQQEVQREVEQARLLREAGLGGESWLAGAVSALRNVLQARKTRSQHHRSTTTKAYSRHKVA